MQSVSIPIRFTQDQKQYLQSQANKAGLPLSAYIRNQVTDSIPKVSKAQSLLNLLDELDISKKDIDAADFYSKEMRKNFKLTSTR